MNSVVQALSHTDPIVDFFLSNEYSGDINADNPIGYKGKVAKAFAETVKEIWSGNHKTVTPKQIKEKAGRMREIFAGYSQQDAQELLITLLDGL